MGEVVKSPAPLVFDAASSIFLAGGISNCADWQEGTGERLAADTSAIIFNPRRTDFDMNAYEEISRQQIKWEYAALRIAKVNLFWFPPETLCPITLLELGSAMERLPQGALMVGCHPDYQRKFDVEVQMALRNHGRVFDNLGELVEETIKLLNT